jgi:iron complex outermembrane receptor protein
MPAPISTGRSTPRTIIPIMPRPMTISIRATAASPAISTSDNAGRTIDPSQHIIGRDHFTKMSHELRIASPADKPPALRRRPVLPAPVPPHPPGLSGHQPRPRGVGQRLPGHALADPAGPRRQGLCRVRRGELRHRRDLTLTGGLRAYKYDNADRLLRLRPQSGGPPPRSTVPEARAPASPAASRRPARPCATIPARCCRRRSRLALHRSRSLLQRQGRSPSRPRATASPTASTSPGRSRPTTWSTRPGRAASGRAASTGAAPSPPYSEDTLTNYELGFQSQWGRPSLNGAIFWQDWKQVPILLPRREQLHRDPQRPGRPDQGRRARLQLAADPGLQPLGSAAYTDAKTRRNLCLIDDPTFTCAPGPQGQIVSRRPAPACR